MTSDQYVDLEPTRPGEYAAFMAKRLPAPEQIDDATYLLPIPMFGGGDFVTNTLCYVLRGPDSAAHLIDAGMNTDSGWEVLRSALDAWNLGPVATVVVTHLHIDHIGMAERVRQEWGARVIMGETEWRTYLSSPTADERKANYDKWGVPVDRRPVMPPELEPGHTSPNMGPQRLIDPPDQFVHDKDVLDLGRPVTVMLTPGHTEGGISLRDDAHRLIITGDQILPHMHAGIGLDYDPTSDPIGDYLEACGRMAMYDGYETLPGHGFGFRKLGLRLVQTTNHHLRRSRQVAEALATYPNDSVWTLASRLSWSYGFENLEGYFLNSALQQTAMHRTFVRNTARSAPWLAVTDTSSLLLPLAGDSEATNRTDN